MMTPLDSALSDPLHLEPGLLPRVEASGERSHGQEAAVEELASRTGR